MADSNDPSDTTDAIGVDDSMPTDEYDSAQPPSLNVVEAVAAATDSTPTEFRPLYEVIDPDALDSMVRLTAPVSPVTISFQYAGCTVTVDEDGRARATLIDDE